MQRDRSNVVSPASAAWLNIAESSLVLARSSRYGAVAASLYAAGSDFVSAASQLLSVLATSVLDRFYNYLYELTTERAPGWFSMENLTNNWPIFVTAAAGAVAAGLVTCLAL